MKVIFKKQGTTAILGITKGLTHKKLEFTEEEIADNMGAFKDFAIYINQIETDITEGSENE